LSTASGWRPLAAPVAVLSVDFAGAGGGGAAADSDGGGDGGDGLTLFRPADDDDDDDAVGKVLGAPLAALGVAAGLGGRSGPPRGDSAAPPCPPREREARVPARAARSGVAHCVAFWHTLILDEEESLSNAPRGAHGGADGGRGDWGRGGVGPWGADATAASAADASADAVAPPDGHWGQAVQWIPPRRLRRGERIEIRCRVDGPPPPPTAGDAARGSPPPPTAAAARFRLVGGRRADAEDGTDRDESSGSESDPSLSSSHLSSSSSSEASFAPSSEGSWPAADDAEPAPPRTACPRWDDARLRLAEAEAALSEAAARGGPLAARALSLAARALARRPDGGRGGPGMGSGAGGQAVAARMLAHAMTG